MSSAKLELVQLNRQLENENRTLKFSLRKYDKEMRNTGEEVASTQKWIDELQTEIKNMNAKLSESEAELRTKQAEKDGLQQELNEMKAQVAVLEERLSQIEEPAEVDPEIIAIEKEIDDLQSQVEQLKSRKQTTENVLEERRAELDVQKKSLEWKETELKAAAETATFLQQKMDDLERDFPLSAASASSSAPSVGLPSILAKPVAQDGALARRKDSMEVDVDVTDKAKEYNRVGWTYSTDADAAPKSSAVLNINRPFIRRPSTRLSGVSNKRFSVKSRMSLQGGRNIAGGTSPTPTKRKRPQVVWDDTELSREAPIKRHLAQMDTFSETCGSGSMGSVTAQDNGAISTSSALSHKKHPSIVLRDLEANKHAVIHLGVSGGGITTVTEDKKLAMNGRASANVSTTDNAEACLNKVGTVARPVDDDLARPAAVLAGCTSGTPAQKERRPIVLLEAKPSKRVPVKPPAAGNVAASIVPRKHPFIVYKPDGSFKDTAGLFVMPKRTADRANTPKSSLESMQSLTVDETELPSVLPALKDPPSICDNNSESVKEKLDRAAAAKKHPPIKWP